MVRPFVLLVCGTLLGAVDIGSLTLPNDRYLPLGDVWGLEGGAGVARADGAIAGYRNPAGLGGIAKNEVMAAASIFQYSRSGADNFFGGDEYRYLNIVPGSAGTASAIPTLFGDAGDRWGLALLVASPVQWKSATSQQRAELQPTGTVITSETTNQDYSVIEPSLALGRTVGRNLRFGLATALQIHQLSTATSRSVGNLGAQTSTIAASQVNGTCLLGRLDAGFQWQDAESGWAMGAVASSPGIRLWSSGSRTDTELSSNVPGDTTATTYGSTNDYPLHLRSPPRLTAALARVRPRYELECDLTLAYGGGSYDAYPGFRLQQIVTTGGIPAPRTVDQPARVDRRREVTNIALGGCWIANAAWRLHGGLQSDLSPVRDSDVFSQVNLWSVSTGVSYESEHTLTSAGFVYTWSTSGDGTSALSSAGANDLSTDLLYRSLNLVLGSRYRF